MPAYSRRNGGIAQIRLPFRPQLPLRLAGSFENIPSRMLVFSDLPSIGSGGNDTVKDAVPEFRSLPQLPGRIVTELRGSEPIFPSTDFEFLQGTPAVPGNVLQSRQSFFIGPGIDHPAGMLILEGDQQIRFRPAGPRLKNTIFAAGPPFRRRGAAADAEQKDEEYRNNETLRMERNRISACREPLSTSHSPPYPVEFSDCNITILPASALAITGSRSRIPFRRNSSAERFPPPASAAPPYRLEIRRMTVSRVCSSSSPHSAIRRTSSDTISARVVIPSTRQTVI